MATLALPRLKAPNIDVRGLASSPALRLVAASMVFLVVAYVLASLLGPPGGGAVTGGGQQP